MPHKVTTQDADILNRLAKRGDTKALGKALDDLAQREAPYGIDRAEILLLAKDEAGDNVVHAACAYGNEDVVEFVCGLDVFALKPGGLRSVLNARNGASDTPIHHAAQNGNQACAAVLLQHGANIKAAGSFGFCVAHYATSKGHLEVLRYLLQNEADPSAASKSGDTPGHIAAREKNMGCLKALHEAGADLRVLNMAGQTPANIAQSKGNEEMMVWMMEQGIF